MKTCRRGHVLNEKNLYIGSNGKQRRCRVCMKERQKAIYNRDYKADPIRHVAVR